MIFMCVVNRTHINMDLWLILFILGGSSETSHFPVMQYLPFGCTTKRVRDPATDQKKKNLISYINQPTKKIQGKVNSNGLYLTLKHVFATKGMVTS